MTLAERINYIATTRWQNTRFYWVPVELRLGGRNPFATVALPGDRFLSYNLEPDREERVVLTLGRFALTRLETPEERDEREEGEAEDAYMERELNRYTEWHY